jgi:cytochrome c-type biogenesis protein
MKSQWTFIDWAQSGEPLVRVLPALLFFIIAVLPLAIQLLRKKLLGTTYPGRFEAGLLIIFSGIFVILGIAQAAGILDSADLLARWLIYQQQSL